VKVLGVDPGTSVTGYGVIETGNGSGMGRLIECGVIRFASKSPLPQRLHALHEQITKLIARHRPGALALENVFYAKNVHTTLVLGHARGVILLAAEQKAQVGRLVARLLRLKQAPTPADAADGVAVALTHILRT